MNLEEKVKEKKSLIEKGKLLELESASIQTQRAMILRSYCQAVLDSETPYLGKIRLDGVTATVKTPEGIQRFDPEIQYSTQKIAEILPEFTVLQRHELPMGNREWAVRLYATIAKQAAMLGKTVIFIETGYQQPEAAIPLIEELRQGKSSASYAIFTPIGIVASQEFLDTPLSCGSNDNFNYSIPRTIGGVLRQYGMVFEKPD